MLQATAEWFVASRSAYRCRAVRMFLFEDHKIARANLLLSAQSPKVRALAFLIFPDQKGWLE